MEDYKNQRSEDLDLSYLDIVVGGIALVVMFFVIGLYFCL